MLDLDEYDVEYEAPPRTSPYTMDVRKREAQESIERGMELSKSVAKIIGLINAEEVGLEFFKWRNSYGVNYIRSNAFWEALWETAGNLKGLELGFYKDELAVNRHGLKVNAPSVKLTALTNLVIDASNAHGHDGSLVDSILLSSPAVENLILHLTNCDLEDCRIRNITWSYTFPLLTDLALYAYNSNEDALSSCLDRHPSVTTLTWDAHWAYDLKTTYEKVLLGPTPIWKIKDLKISNLESSHELILALSSALENLDLDIGVSSWREGTYSFRAEDKAETEREREEERAAGGGEEKYMTPEYVEKTGEPLQVLLKSILGKLENLRALCVDLESGKTYAKNEITGKYDVHPRAIDGEDLKTFLVALGDSTSVRRLKMSDSKGSSFSGGLFDQEAPENFEVLEWYAGKGS